VRIEVWLLGDVAHALAVGHQVVANGLAVEEDLAGARLDETGDDLHRGRLAGAVGTEIASDLTCARNKADVFYDCEAGIAFRDVANLEHR
jgi:hypothetical protein